VAEHDLILDETKTPTLEDILSYINEPGKKLWVELNSFITQQFKTSPKITYSSCSGKPGWNVKYQKSGKSLCTVYPEKDGFVALAVVKLELMPVIEGLQGELDAEIMGLIKAASPFNGTLWLMIPVYRETMLAGLQKLLILKVNAS